VERRHERAVEQIDDLVGEPVAFVLEVLDVARPVVGVLREMGEQVDEGRGDRDDVLRGPVVEVEELAFLRDEVDPRHGDSVFIRVTVRCGQYRPLQMGFETPVFQVFRGKEPPRFASQAELECAKVLDYYGVPWEYEPTTFVLEQDEAGRVTEAFAPDFYLPDQDLYVELTVMKQSLVTRKNRKLRKLRERYPNVKIKLFYKRDIARLAERYKLDLAS